MEASTLTQVGELGHPRSSSPDGETVCGALARYEHTLREAIRKIHVDVSSFKLGMERRLEETANLSSPLGQAVAQLQHENRQLRSQLEVLTRQVELLSGVTCDRSLLVSRPGEENHRKAASQTPRAPSPTVVPSSPRNSPPAGSSLLIQSPGSTRFSSKATFALSSKTNSVEREETIEADPAPAHTGQENGHAAAATEHSAIVHGKISPSNGSPHEHTAPVAMRMPHLPITATTKMAETRGSSAPSSSSSPPSEAPPPSSFHPQPIDESPTTAVPFTKPWTPTLTRSPSFQGEKTHSAPAKSVTYAGRLQTDRDSEASSQKTFSPAVERRRELVRSQTLPRNIGAQARRSIFEKPDSEVKSRPKEATLKRSQSFGVSSASSIKQILLEWCRSKTIGYQNIDIQNFSSSWNDGMAFCALVHSFFPNEFDYNTLSPGNRKHNFELAFRTAEDKAGCDRLIEVDDMIIMGRKPDPMCVFTYVQSLYNHLRKFE